MAVPEILLSGNHAQIERWRRRESLRRTLARRPDLLERAPLTEEDRDFLEELKGQEK
jgi:tRNA (guanine37-N1)-methyltransferase